MPIDSISYDPSKPPLVDTVAGPSGDVRYRAVLNIRGWQVDPALSTLGTRQGDVVSGRVVWARTASRVYLWAETPEGPVRVATGPVIPGTEDLAAAAEDFINNPPETDQAKAWWARAREEAALIPVVGGCVFPVGADLWHWCAVTDAIYKIQRTDTGVSYWQFTASTGEEVTGPSSQIPRAWSAAQTDLVPVLPLDRDWEEGRPIRPLRAYPAPAGFDLAWATSRVQTVPSLTTQERQQAIARLQTLAARSAEQIVLLQYASSTESITTMARVVSVLRRLNPFGPFLTVSRVEFAAEEDDPGVVDPDAGAFPQEARVLCCRPAAASVLALPLTASGTSEVIQLPSFSGEHAGVSFPPVGQESATALVWDTSTVYGLQGSVPRVLITGSAIETDIVRCGWSAVGGENGSAFLCVGPRTGGPSDSLRVLCVDPLRVSGQADRSGTAEFGAASVLWGFEMSPPPVAFCLDADGQGSVSDDPVTVTRDPDVTVDAGSDGDA